MTHLTSDVATLCRHPTRAIGTEGHRAARSYLLKRFAELGLEPYAGTSYQLPYQAGRESLVNLAGLTPNADPALAPVLIGAHYDTVSSTPGADDNAAAIAIALEVMRRLVADPAARPVLLVSFDAEEPPYFHSPLMGSTRFVADQMRQRVHAALVLDLVGRKLTRPGFENMVAVMGCESHPQLAAAVSESNSKHLSVATLPNRYYPDMSDHYAFRVAAMPFLFFSCGQGKHYHRPSDTPDTLDYPKMERVTDLLEELVRRAAAAPMSGAVKHDTAELDTANLRRLLGDGPSDAMGLRTPRDFPDAIQRVIFELQGA